MRSPARSLASLLLVTSPAACQDASPTVRRVQRAVGVAAPGALAQREAPASREAIPESAPAREALDDDAPPRAAGEGASLRFAPDPAHREIATAPAGDGVAVAWTNDAHDGLWLGLTDARGAARGRGVRVHAAAEDEEHVGAPAVVAAGEGFGVAWVDRENGRVLLARLDASRRPLGAATIVHAGLESPRSATLAWTGRGYGLGVALWRGVYFAQLDASGGRVGDGEMLSEGDAVAAIEAVRWERGGFTVAWTADRGGRVERVERRAQAQAPRAGGDLVGAIAPTRRAM